MIGREEPLRLTVSELLDLMVECAVSAIEGHIGQPLTLRRPGWVVAAAMEQIEHFKNTPTIKPLRLLAAPVTIKCEVCGIVVETTAGFAEKGELAVTTPSGWRERLSRNGHSSPPLYDHIFRCPRCKV